MFCRLRSALIPRDPIYRRESGAGRRVVLATKVSAGIIVIGAYSYWMFMAGTGRDYGQIPVNITAVACCLFCLIFFALGIQSVRGEVADGTAEALIMTPAGRHRLVISKLAGSVELVVVAALLVPLYCFTLPPELHGDRIMAFLHGAVLRLGLTPDDWISGGGQPLSVEILIGVGAFLGDLAWYVFFCSCGIWAGCTARNTLRAWLKGLAISGMLLCVLTGLEWFLGDTGNYYWLFSAIRGGKWHEFAYALDFGWRDRSLSWVAIWFAIAVLVRILLGALFVHRAALSFDRIATD